MYDLTINLARSDIQLLDVILRQRGHHDGLETALPQIGADRLESLALFLSEQTSGKKKGGESGDGVRSHIDIERVSCLLVSRRVRGRR